MKLFWDKIVDIEVGENTFNGAFFYFSLLPGSFKKS